jgi:Rap1a immunity proteins
MRLGISIAVAALLFSLSVQADEAFYSGNQILSMCESQSAFDYGRCLGYVLAVSDIMGMTMENTGWVKNCQPPGVTSDQLKDVVVQYLRNHPADHHYAAPGPVLMALSQAFPCR